MSQPERILLTGPPGCGKTTAVLRTLEAVHRSAVGFYTEEVRSGSGGGRRIGFDVVALDGRRGPLARAGLPGPRVGRYGVDLGSFESVGVRALRDALARPDLLAVIDEIGKMELLSPAFVRILEQVFEARNPVLGTILRGVHPVADAIRQMPGVRVISVSQANRDSLPNELAPLFVA
jgi:nucleoside-triphosphatase